MTEVRSLSQSLLQLLTAGTQETDLRSKADLLLQALRGAAGAGPRLVGYDGADEEAGSSAAAALRHLKEVVQGLITAGAEAKDPTSASQGPREGDRQVSTAPAGGPAGGPIVGPDGVQVALAWNRALAAEAADAATRGSSASLRKLPPNRKRPRPPAEPGRLAEQDASGAGEGGAAPPDGALGGEPRHLARKRAILAAVRGALERCPGLEVRLYAHGEWGAAAAGRQVAHPPATLMSDVQHVAGGNGAPGVPLVGASASPPLPPKEVGTAGPDGGKQGAAREGEAEGEASPGQLALVARAEVAVDGIPVGGREGRPQRGPAGSTALRGDIAAVPHGVPAERDGAPGGDATAAPVVAEVVVPGVMRALVALAPLARMAAAEHAALFSLAEKDAQPWGMSQHNIFRQLSVEVAAKMREQEEPAPLGASLEDLLVDLYSYRDFFQRSCIS